jgi:hypothetical protein
MIQACVAHSKCIPDTGTHGEFVEWLVCGLLSCLVIIDTTVTGYKIPGLAFVAAPCGG